MVPLVAFLDEGFAWNGTTYRSLVLAKQGSLSFGANYVDVIAGVRGRQSAIGNVLTLQFLICTLSQPSCTGLVRIPIPSISTS